MAFSFADYLENPLSTPFPSSEIAGVGQKLNAFLVADTMARIFNEKLPLFGVRFKCTVSGFDIKSPFYLKPVEFVVVASELFLLAAGLSSNRACAADITVSGTRLLLGISATVSDETLDVISGAESLLDLGRRNLSGLLNLSAALAIAEAGDWDCGFETVPSASDNLRLKASVPLFEHCFDRLRSDTAAAFERLQLENDIAGYIVNQLSLAERFPDEGGD